MVAATRLSPVCTVKVKVPMLHTPFPCAEPSENLVWPSFPASLTGLVASAPVSPVIVTLELAAAVRLVSVISVTVMLLFAPGYGLF